MKRGEMTTGQLLTAITILVVVVIIILSWDKAIPFLKGIPSLLFPNNVGAP